MLCAATKKKRILSLQPDRVITLKNFSHVFPIIMEEALTVRKSLPVSVAFNLQFTGP